MDLFAVIIQDIILLLLFESVFENVLLFVGQLSEDLFFLFRQICISRYFLSLMADFHFGGEDALIAL